MNQNASAVAAGVALAGVGLFVYLAWDAISSGSIDDAFVNVGEDLGVDTTVSSGGDSYSYPMTRGFRNCNPGNLRYIAVFPWNGQVGNDNGYAIYESMQKGVRAAWKQLNKYVYGGKDTIIDIISTWAPSTENNTQAYIMNVANRCQIGANNVIGPTSYAQILDAIFVQENGSNPISLDTITLWGTS